MIGYPKYKVGDKVSFIVNKEVLHGDIYIYVVDRYGTFEDDTDVCYDIYVKDENTIYKHINEKNVERI
jgi:ribosomal protein L21E